MREWGKYLYEFGRKAFNLTRAALGVVGIIAVLALSRTQYSLPESAVFLLTVVFLMVGAYEAYRGERLQRETRERAFQMEWGFRGDGSHEDWRGRTLRSIRGRAIVRMEATDRDVRVNRFRLTAFYFERGLKTLWLWEKRRLFQELECTNPEEDHWELRRLAEPVRTVVLFDSGPLGAKGDEAPRLFYELTAFSPQGNVSGRASLSNQL